jgi:hypothetical protein
MCKASVVQNISCSCATIDLAATRLDMKREGIEMSRQDNKNEEVKARWKEFWDDHREFDSAWARNVLHMLSEFLPFVFKFDAVPEGLGQLYAKSDVQFPADFDWSRDWTEASEVERLPAGALEQLPIFRLALALDAYAYYGLKLKIDEDDVHGLDTFLEDSEEKRYALFPREWGRDEKMEQTVTAAFARRKLDHPENAKGLTPEELAALVRLPRKNIVNLLAPANRGVLKVDPQGLIAIESARTWLLARRDFRPSIWQQQGESVPAPHTEPLLGEDPVFVPVASDGTWFSPNDCNEKDKRYQVANGDREENYVDYWEALEFLSRSRFPRWRYHDAAGRWRTKLGTGDDWLRKSRAEIESLLRATRSDQTKSIQPKGRRQ